jgi:hypothetical protein
LLKVHGQLGGNLACALAVACLCPLADSQMQPLPPPRR